MEEERDREEIRRRGKEEGDGREGPIIITSSSFSKVTNFILSEESPH